MYYGEIKTNDIANGEGVRTALFVSGCTRHCKNCFNKQTWDFNFGTPFTAETEEYIFDVTSPDWVQGLTVLGGEPMEIENQRALYPFLKKYKEKFPNKDLWIFTGFLFDEDLTPGGQRYTEVTDDILALVDVIVDGRFVEELHDITLQFRGSSNQRVIDVKKSLQNKKVVIWEKLKK
jgi:anaerobic ribonucleoside-triphosphate reductase activating protein